MGVDRPRPSHLLSAVASAETTTWRKDGFIFRHVIAQRNCAFDQNTSNHSARLKASPDRVAPSHKTSTTRATTRQRAIVNAPATAPIEVRRRRSGGPAPRLVLVFGAKPTICSVSSREGCSVPCSNLEWWRPNNQPAGQGFPESNQGLCDAVVAKWGRMCFPIPSAFLLVI
jgi:hypothetical protein